MIIHLSDYRKPVSVWRSYRVHAVDQQGQPLALTYRAMSINSARFRAFRDGARRVEAIEEIR
jgi:hypothetical protein